MGRLRLAKLPYLVVLFLYIGRLVAIVHSQNENTQQDGGGVVNSGCSHLNSKRNCFLDDREFDKLSSLLSKTDSISETSDILSDLPSSVPVTFAPPALDFKEQSVGMPVLYSVTLTNPTNSLTLQLISISGTLPEFHSSFFIDKVLRPGETTSFEVMFLPRVPGELEDIIIIHSSLGIFEYKVRGVGVASLFRLRSLRGARIPLNATYQPLISIYNPFTVPLQIVEVYSSSQFIHIEMLSGSDEGNKSAWGIRPFETKTIARVNFHGESIDNFTSFIRIKSNHFSEPSIVLPFEVEVCQAHGLFLSREYLDFGVVRTGAETKLWLYMLNAGPYTVELKSMTLPDDLPIVVNFTNISLKPGLKYIRVASLSFFVNSTTPGGKSTGIIKIWGEDHTSFYHVQVPYEAHIMKGSLDYDADAMLFRVDAPPFYPIIRNLTLTNLFEDPVVIYSAKLSSKVQNWFTILSFSSPYVLPPDAAPHTVLVLRFNPQSSDCLFNTTLRLSTNMSFFNIPLQCYDGRLDYTFEDTDTDALEFGVLSDQERVNKIFTITNNNPVKVAINSITVQEGSNIPGVSVDAILFPPHEPKTRTPPILMEGLRRGRYPPRHVLKPGQFVIYRVNVTCPKTTGSYTGEILIHSSLGKVTPVPINYVAVKGELTFIPKLIEFHPSYPCLCSVIRLSVKNSFTKPVKLVSLVLESVGNSSLPLRLPGTLPVLKPSTTTLIGEVRLDPFSVFDKKKLTKINLNCTSLMSGQRVKNDYSLIREYAHLNSLWSVWADLLRQSSSLLINFNIRLFYNVTMATATDRQEVTSAQGKGPLVWPRIASSHTVSFPLTLIGNYTEMKLLLRNPSPHPLYIQPLLLSSGQPDSSQKLLSLLSEIYKLKPFASNFSKNSFGILRSEPVKGPVLDPLDLILPPRGTGTLTVRYNPIQEYNNNNNDTDVLLLKNNLTVLDPVILKGFSSRGFITIDGVHPSNGNQGGALLFEFSQSMLEGYINGMECGMSTTDLLTHWKLFHVRNSGPAPITINRISIGPNGGCQGNGFKVSNCRKQFIIYPNKTRNIEISCSPDFTVSRISSSLVLHSSKGSKIEFLLSALLPYHMLSLCYMATPPSDLEYMTAYLSVPLWIIALLIMIIVTVLQVKWHTSKLLQPVVARETLVVKDVPIQSTGGKLFSFSDIKKMASNISPTQHQSVKGPIENVIFSTSSSVSSLSISSNISPVTLSPLSTVPSPSVPSPTVPSPTVPSPSVPSSSVLSVHYSSKQDQSVTDYETGMRHQTTPPTPPPTTATVTCADKPDRTSSTNSRPHPPEHNVKKVKPIQRKSSRSVTSERGVAPLDDKPDELLVRKESDESLPNSDDTSSGGSVSGSVGGASEDFSPVEEHPGAKRKNKPHPQSSKPHPSYTKEPLTGQTVEVKEEPQTDEDLTTPTTELTTPPHLIKAVKSKKKQKQLKKEDKLTKRRQREAPAVTNNSNTIVTNNSNSVSSNSSSTVTNNSNGTGLRSKRFHGSQESLDKESVASNSTNSTDNNDEEQTQPTQEEAPPTQEEAPPTQAETKELEQLHNDPVATHDRGRSVSEEPLPVKDTDPPPPDPVLEVEPIPKESSPKPRPQKLKLSQEGGAEDIKSAESGPSSVETDGTVKGEREGGAVTNNNEKQQRKDPHQLAASLLQTNKEKIIVRRVVSNEEEGGEKRTEAVVTSPLKERKRHSTGGEEKRSNPSPSSLSHDATPFYPGFTPHHHQFPHPHHIPLGRPHLPQPRPPHPHHIPPLYDYPPPPGPHMHYHPISEEGPYPPPDSRHYESVINRKHVKHSKQFHLPLPAGGTPPGVTPPPPYYGPGPYREMTPPHMYDERIRPHPPMDHYYDVDYYHGMKHRSEMGRGPPGAPPPGWRPKRTSFESPPISHVKPGPDEYEHVHVPAYEEQPMMRSSSRFHGYHHMENIDSTPHHDSYSISRLREGGVVPSYPVHHDDMKLLANKRLTDGVGAKLGGSNSGTSLSLLLSQSSSSGWSSSLNRAPGTIPSNNQYSKIPSTHYGGERNWIIDENEKDVLTRFGPDSSDTSTCQRLWSLNSPLSNALEEQRLQTATQLAAAPSPSPPPPPLFPPSGDNYDPFDNSLSSIWSFGNRGNTNRGGTLLWDTESDD